jgi:hypothetical protein
MDLTVPLVLLLMAGLAFAGGRAIKRDSPAPAAEPEPAPAQPPARNPSWTDPRPGIDD